MPSLLKVETQKYIHYQIILVKEKCIINQEFNYSYKNTFECIC